MSAQRAEHPGYGIAWTFERRGSDVYFWCANCEARLFIEVNDKGQPLVANHMDVGDCNWHSKMNSMVNNFLWKVVQP